ncbi:MAG: hypothetical protein BroJett001_33280 [Chloroflexota bacterium]|nr:MAG: hypothetical protein BroJett001_33280 [Chloroflexota bacterium]
MLSAKHYVAILRDGRERKRKEERVEIARQSLDLGANAYVPKSTSFDEFSQRVVRIVDFWSQVGQVA